MGKKQTIVAQSSTESEYRALAHASSEVIWLQQLLSEMRMKSHLKPIMWCDNVSVGALAANLVFHAKTKHIEFDVHFLKDQVLKGFVEVQYVPTTDQLADCLMKPISHS